MGNGVSLQARAVLDFLCFPAIIYAFAMVVWWVVYRTYRNRIRVWEALIVAKRGDFNTLCFAAKSRFEISREDTLRLRGSELAIIHADNPQDKDMYPTGSEVLARLKRSAATVN